MSDSPRLIITPGEPAGIGPDLVLQLVHDGYRAELDNTTICVIADKNLLQQRATELNLSVDIKEVNCWQEITPSAQRLHVMHVPCAKRVVAGQLDQANAGYVLRCLDRAIELCMNELNCALVTGPVHKGIINDAGISFSGHTEYLAENSGTARPVMMLATPGLRVALATTHLPLLQVSQHITSTLLQDVITILHDDLQNKFHIERPRITICGLNPHAGESGHLGTEEINIITPVIEKLQHQGMQLTGPVSADTAFTPDKMQQCDAYLAMYHDQGLPVLKHVGFGHAVNITLGLPFIRTSVDHGTALELAGSGKADLSSLRYALIIAQQMLNRAEINV